MKKLLVIVFVVFVGVGVKGQTTDYFRTTPGNQEYHQFNRNSTGAAVYINQVSTTGPILKLSSSTETPNTEVKISFENNGDINTEGNINASGRLSLRSNNSTGLGDLISLYGDRWNHNAMYGFGIETNGGNLYSRANAGHNWYIGTVADNGTSSLMSLRTTGLGLGTTSPYGKLHLNGNSQRLIFSSIDANMANSARIEFWEIANATNPSGAQFAMQYDGSGDKFIFKGSYGTYSDKDLMVIKRNGFVGIGKSNPSFPLEVIGEIRSSNSSNSGLSRIGNGEYGGYLSAYNSSGEHTVLVRAYEINGIQAFFNSGNVLIGKTTQTNSTYKLDVNGKARANEIVVNTDGADFVFEDSYKLRKLEEVESYIKANKHLPEIASAEEMQKNGVGVGELNTKLLQKVEELTLYAIEQNKKTKEQSIKIKEQEKVLKEQSKKIKVLQEKESEIESLKELVRVQMEAIEKLSEEVEELKK